MLREHYRLFVFHRCEPDKVVSAVNHCASFAVERTVPDAFALYAGIEHEHRGGGWWRRIAEIDAVTVGIAAEAELKAGDISLREPFNGMRSLANASRNRLRSCPEGRG